MGDLWRWHVVSEVVMGSGGLYCGAGMWCGHCGGSRVIACGVLDDSVTGNTPLSRLGVTVCCGGIGAYFFTFDIQSGLLSTVQTSRMLSLSVCLSRRVESGWSVMLCMKVTHWYVTQSLFWWLLLS